MIVKESNQNEKNNFEINLLELFFEHLAIDRGLSENTIISYRSKKSNLFLRM